MKNTKLINDLILASGNPEMISEERNLMQEAATAIRELQDELLKKWIPVSEQLPKPYEPIILARIYEPGKPLKIEAGMLQTGGWWKVYGTNVKRGVLFWMPMPEAPEMEEDKK